MLDFQYAFYVVLLIFSIYFLYNEYIQLRKRKMAYFFDFWNYIDVLPSVMITLICLTKFGIRVVDNFYSDPRFVCLLSFISLLMWLKIGYFLRLYSSFAYLINMILRVIKDMVYFLVVLAIGLAAFTESFLIVSDSLVGDDNDENEQGFAGSPIYAVFYVYRMAVGDFDFSDFDGKSLTIYYLWFLFFACTMFNMIIMLNLLIAIISESFAAVNAT